jgi:hypothetical protein
VSTAECTVLDGVGRGGGAADEGLAGFPMASAASGSRARARGWRLGRRLGLTEAWLPMGRSFL